MILPYMGMAPILVICPGSFEQTVVRLSHWGSLWKLALIGSAVFEEKMLEEYGRRTDDDDGRTMERGYNISSPMSLKAQMS